MTELSMKLHLLFVFQSDLFIKNLEISQVAIPIFISLFCFFWNKLSHLQLKWNSTPPHNNNYKAKQVGKKSSNISITIHRIAKDLEEHLGVFFDAQSNGDTQNAVSLTVAVLIGRLKIISNSRDFDTEN